MNNKLEFLCVLLVIGCYTQSVQMASVISITTTETTDMLHRERSIANRELDHHVSAYDPAEQPIIQWASGAVTYGVYQRYQQMILEKKGLAPIQP